MRIACVHIPQFALQTLTRIDPSLRGAAVAVVGSGLDVPGVSARAALTSPVVQACSRAAWALGVRIGMTAMAANGLAPDQLRVVTSDGGLERETVRAIADALLGVSSIVDVGGRIGPAGAHLALYCEVPSKTRGTSFGDKLVELLATLGLTARIGIADDRFTAWVAAAHGTPAKRADAGVASLDDSGVVSVPRGGSAAFLSPRPLSLLAITPEVQHMLEALGVSTLGEFSALPAPSVARPIEADYQALARGDSGQHLRPYAPEAPIREDIVVSTVEGGLHTGAAIAQLAERIAVRLAGRGRGAARFEVTLSSASGDQVVPITPGVTRSDRVLPVSSLVEPIDQRAGRRVVDDSEEIASAIELAIDAEQAPWRIRAVVTGEAIANEVAANANVAQQGAPVLAVVASGSGATRKSATPLLDLLEDRDMPPAEVQRDMLGVVLASTGSASDSGSWRLTSPSRPQTLRDERRDAHRRTRRGKEADRRRDRDREFIQARLFADRK